MYYKELETDKAAKEAHNNNLKKNASDRLKANAEYNKKNKRKKED